MNMKRPLLLITHAIKAEYVPITIDGCKVAHIFTGIGKAAAAMNLTRAICENRPDYVINIGTAGTLNHSVGDIITCNRFVDRDFQVTHLPGIDFEITVETTQVCELLPEGWKRMIQKAAGTCNTGDSFVTEVAHFDGDVVDMEAYAQALVCRELSVPFVAVKYVTDIIGKNSVQHWEDKLSDARLGIDAWVKKL